MRLLGMILFSLFAVPLTFFPSGGQAVETSLIRNGDFSDGKHPWKTHTTTGVQFRFHEGYARINIGDARGRKVNNQLYQRPFAIRQGMHYRLSFSARAEKPATMRAIVHQHGSPYRNLGLREAVSLTSEMQTFSYEFTGKRNETNARLRFWLKGISHNEIIIDDVVLEEAGVVAAFIPPEPTPPIVPVEPAPPPAPDPVPPVETVPPTHSDTLIRNGHFSGSVDPWKLYTESRSVLILSNSGHGSQDVATVVLDGSGKRADLGQDGIPLQSGKQYRMTLDLKGIGVNVVNLHMHNNGQNGENIGLHDHGLPVSNVWQPHEILFTATKTTQNARFGMRMDNTERGQLFIDNVTLTMVGDGHIPSDPPPEHDHGHEPRDGHGHGGSSDPRKARPCDFAIGAKSPKGNFSRNPGRFAGNCHPKGCRPGEVFVEVHAWWTPIVEGTGEDTGHTHMGFCYPHKAGVNGMVDWPFEITMFHSPSTLDRMKLSVTDKRPRYWPRQPLSTTSCNKMECNFWTTFQNIDTPKFGNDQRRFRFTTKRHDPPRDGKKPEVDVRTRIPLNVGGGAFDKITVHDVDEAAVSVNAWYGSNGDNESSTEFDNYSSLQIFNPPLVPIPYNGSYDLIVKRGTSAKSHSSKAGLLSWMAAINPNSHHKQVGVPMCGGYEGRMDVLTNLQNKPFESCPNTGRIMTIKIEPAKLGLERGWHKILIRNTLDKELKGAFLSSNLAIYFEVE